MSRKTFSKKLTISYWLAIGCTRTNMAILKSCHWQTCTVQSAIWVIEGWLPSCVKCRLGIEREREKEREREREREKEISLVSCIAVCTIKVIYTDIFAMISYSYK